MAANLGVAGGALLLVVLRVFLLERPRTPSLRFDYQHRWVVEDMRTADRQLAVGPTAVVTKGAYTRPNLTHWLLSKLPSTAEKTGYQWFGALAEPMFVFAMVLVAAWTDGFPITAFGVALVAIVTTPQFVRSDRPGNPGFDPTKLGLSVSAVGIGSMVPWVVSGNPAWLFVGAVLTSLVVLMDRTALFCHGVAMLTLAAVDLLAIGVLIGGIGLAVLISKGRAIRFLLAHVKFVLSGEEQQYTKAGTGWARFAAEAQQRPLPKLPDPVAAIVFNPFVVTGSITVLAGFTGVFTIDVVDAVFVAWLIGGIIGFVGTSLTAVDIAGPSDAYLLGAVVPAAMLTATGVGTLGTAYTIGVAAAALVGVLFTVVGARRTTRTESDEPWTDLMDALDGFDPGVVLLDPADRASELAYLTDHRVTDVLHNEEASTNDLDVLFPDKHLKLPDGPNVLMSIKYYYNPDLAVFDRERTDLPESMPSSAMPVYENGRYQVFDFDDIIG